MNLWGRNGSNGPPSLPENRSRGNAFLLVLGSKHPSRARRTKTLKERKTSYPLSLTNFDTKFLAQTYWVPVPFPNKRKQCSWDIWLILGVWSGVRWGWNICKMDMYALSQKARNCSSETPHKGAHRSDQGANWKSSLPLAQTGTTEKTKETKLWPINQIFF